MKLFERLDKKYENNSLWQFIKFNIVSFSISLLQLVLANLLPLVFDSVNIALPAFLRPLFDPKVLFENGSKYVVNGVVTWGYVLPFFLSNLIANIYGYFVNMNITFHGKSNGYKISVYIIVVIVLILFSTWLQPRVTIILEKTPLKLFARTIAASVAGFIQFIVIYPLEKFILFKEEK